MALQFTTNIELETGIVVENAYGRVSAVDQASGTMLDAIVDIFINEQAFIDGKQSLSVRFNRTARRPYDRATDGVDVLDLAHDALITVLATQGITATKQL